MKISELDIDSPREGLAGTRGPKVKLLQQALTALGYSVGNTGVDGIYGPRTARAVRSFQQDAGIRVDGDAGPETVQALKAAVKKNKVSVKKAQPLRSLSNSEQARAVLNLIAQPESGGQYAAVYPGRTQPNILDMTLDELFKDMRARGKQRGSSATGRYQYITKTLREITREMGLDPKTTKFNAKTQDAIALYHLRNYHGLDRWLQGKMSSQQFLSKLARTWAGLPDPKTGSSFYKGVLDNRAGVSAVAAVDALDRIRGVA